MTKAIKQKTNNNLDKFIFDDCPICQAMKKAAADGRSLTQSELNKSFKKAERKNKR